LVEIKVARGRRLIIARTVFIVRENPYNAWRGMEGSGDCLDDRFFKVSIS